ncbi:hypothetical protein TSUD_404150 [Trifolium subterraneum]|uniref:Reverse transcriptase domain-containing protein n=1 Tax=Trifolium subterraneum TaxID=3900 RepID=A0A2Z6PCF6_TRISU|nr:hypothetical protein TSUD_404150 [Trifolium subterraneum]
MDDINMENLNINEEEALNFDLEENSDEQHDVNLCLVGRFIHDRPIKFNSIKTRMADVWRPVKSMVVKEATQGLYLFKFFHPIYVEEVMNGGPWLFDNYMLVIDRMKVGVALHDIPLYHVIFWVQIHNVPVGMMLEKVGKGLANYIGEFVEYDKNNSTSFWWQYMRVKVRVDVRRPLKIEKKIMLNGGLGSVVKFKYERSAGVGQMKLERRYVALEVELNLVGYMRNGVVWVVCILIVMLARGSHKVRDPHSQMRHNHALVIMVVIVIRVTSGGSHLDDKDMEVQVERKRRRAAAGIVGDWAARPQFLTYVDKRGNLPHPNWLCMGFRQAISDCDLSDIPLEGYPFTWIKSRGTPHVIEERLDRAMASTSWLNLFPHVRLSNLLASHSDHSPILLHCTPSSRSRFNGSFRFKNSWFREPDLEEVVLDGWGVHENIEVVDRVARCANRLQSWGRKKKGEEEGRRYQEIHDWHVVLMVQEEDYWKQRAKMHWLKEGDMNSSFFHKSATARRKKKNVSKLVDEGGIEVHTQEELCEVAKQYFDTLFKPKNGVLNLIQRRLTEEDNIYPAAPITKDEIQQALFQMHPDKSPGADGFNPSLYQRFWEQCGDDIFVVASNWLDRGLKTCLDKCVSQEQSAFVEGRSILDNALISIEVIHALKRKTKGRRGELALKIDISKAYDKVDWGFLRGVLTSMGFGDSWIRWIMMCVSSVNYSVLMNYDKVGPIIPGRGLRQGDPLSPYLFILVAEGLTSLIHQAVGRGDVHGARICRGAPEVSHLLFADDCFLFCRASVGEVNHLMNILRTYELASGQEINLAKSEVFFSRNLSHAAKEDLASIPGVRHVLGTGRYLDLPFMIGRSKKVIFSYIKDRIWKKMNSWRGRALSKAGKEVMIKFELQAIPSYVMRRSKKVIFSYIKDRIWKKMNSWRGRALSKAGKEVMIKFELQAIPSYVMSMFILPSSLIDDIEKMLNAFWWGGGSNNNKGIHWLAWDRLACPKAKGGLGFRNFEAFNI